MYNTSCHIIKTDVATCLCLCLYLREQGSKKFLGLVIFRSNFSGWPNQTWIWRDVIAKLGQDFIKKKRSELKNSANEEKVNNFQISHFKIAGSVCEDEPFA